MNNEVVYNNGKIVYTNTIDKKVWYTFTGTTMPKETVMALSGAFPANYWYPSSPAGNWYYNAYSILGDWSVYTGSNWRNSGSSRIAFQKIPGDIDSTCQMVFITNSTLYNNEIIQPGDSRDRFNTAPCMIATF
jgi:hypothetical protein